MAQDASFLLVLFSSQNVQNRHLALIHSRRWITNLKDMKDRFLFKKNSVHLTSKVLCFENCSVIKNLARVIVKLWFCSFKSTYKNESKKWNRYREGMDMDLTAMRNDLKHVQIMTWTKQIAKVWKLTWRPWAMTWIWQTGRPSTWTKHV